MDIVEEWIEGCYRVMTSPPPKNSPKIIIYPNKKFAKENFIIFSIFY